MAHRTLRAERTSVSAILERIRAKNSSPPSPAASDSSTSAQSVLLAGIKQFFAQHDSFRCCLETLVDEIAEQNKVIDSNNSISILKLFSSNPSQNASQSAQPVAIKDTPKMAGESQEAQRINSSRSIPLTGTGVQDNEQLLSKQENKSINSASISAATPLATKSKQDTSNMVSTLVEDSKELPIICPKPKVCPFGSSCQRYWDLAASHGFGQHWDQIAIDQEGVQSLFF